MFRRHCVVAEILKTSDWVLFIDADIGIVNPTRLIEEYIDPRYDITFYDRFCSWEVAMGSYIVKNTEFSRNFLMNFADFENRLPNSFHGSDNGAIHAYLLETLVPGSRPDAHVCYSIWHQSSGYEDLFLFESCIRSIIGSRNTFDKCLQQQEILVAKFFKEKILRSKFFVLQGTGWVRDIWITNSLWSYERDFMLHGMKESDRSAVPDGIFSALECSSGTVEWEYDVRLRVSRSMVDKLLHDMAQAVEKRRWKSLARVHGYLGDLL
ncbi:unnamed protein product [Haemonchus placei]|uniref:Nucleotid_trans domain-containing protein n=1 Tax=Haemonchus placei TaxID=6290 RepID=A0A0N4W6K8_HAEPC|nr:unnamed protein product [Haemonchus placei]